MYYVYILLSYKNQRTYVGFTSKVPEQRLFEHNQGANIYTRLNGPWQLKYYESFTCEACARNREKFFKSGKGKKLKSVLIKFF